MLYLETRSERSGLGSTWLRGLYGGHLVVRESRSVVLFAGGGESFVHVSSLLGALVGVEYTGEFTEYTLNLAALRSPRLEVVAASRSEGCLCEVYTVDAETGRVEYSGSLSTCRGLSTGSQRLDALVRDISELRRAWCSSLCECPERAVECYEVFLKARVAHTYNLYRRVKEAWLEYSQEYLGFVYGLVHSALLEHCRVVSAEGLRSVCERACRAESSEWRSVVVEYACRGGSVRVYLERMISGVRPDLLVERGPRRLLIECKQGPTKTWLAKAAKQAKKYRVLSSQLVLATPRALTEQELNTVKQHYDTVISECTPSNQDCREKLLGELLTVL